MINYNNKKFKVLTNSETGELDDSVIFEYFQVGNVIHCQYAGGKVKLGQLIGLVGQSGSISMRYHQVNDKDELRTGRCQSTPKLNNEGKILLYENWQWTSDISKSGQSVLIEI